ncbi:MAG: BREX system Lon protease-like protein BrxL, partial [Desulfamplus sp.]|nr:BREX system Lon protease-like protein BrxL [Desulfamplus sp.]
VKVHTTKGDLQLRIPSLDITGRVMENIVDENPLLLLGNVWGSGTLKWLPQKGKTDRFEVVMTAFKPMQTASIDLNYFINQREKFSFNEWIELLVRCMGYDENKYSIKQKITLLTRLIPLVEPRVNIIELAPKGTGKSYIFSQLSRHAWLISGGVVTRAQLFYDMSRQQTGIISRYNAIVLDEIQTIRLKDEEEIVGALKGYLESGEFRVMGFHGSSDAGFVLLGNIPIEYGQPRDANYFRELPSWLNGEGATALLDRFHGLIHGWELPRIESSSICNSFALRADYFGEVLYALRSCQEQMAFVKDHSESSGDLRDTRAVQRVACGFLKLFFPDIKTVSINEFDEFCLQPAIKLRSNIRHQMAIMDSEFSPDISEIILR